MSTYFLSFFFNDTATTEIYTLSLHDALPIFAQDTYSRLYERDFDISPRSLPRVDQRTAWTNLVTYSEDFRDRKSTRLNSSHSQISYAVFCLKKKKKKSQTHIPFIHVLIATRV